MTSGWQGVGTKRRLWSLSIRYSISFSTVNLSLPTHLSFCPDFANKGVNESSCLCNTAMLFGTSQVELYVFGSVGHSCFSKRHWRRVFLGPLVPPSHRLLSKCGSGSIPGFAWARVMKGHETLTLASSESVLTSSSFSCSNSMRTGKSHPRLASTGKFSSTPTATRKDCLSTVSYVSFRVCTFIPIHTKYSPVNHSQHSLLAPDSVWLATCGCWYPARH